MNAWQATEQTITASEKRLRRQAGNVPSVVGEAMLANAEKGSRYAKSAMNTIADAANAGLTPVQRYTMQATNSVSGWWNNIKGIFTGDINPSSLIAQFGNSITDWFGDKTSSLFDENGIKLTNFTDKLEDVVPAANAAGAAMEGAGKSAKKGGKDVAEAADQVSHYIEKMENSFNLFDEFKLGDDEENPLTGDQLLHNMQSNIDGMTQWANEMVSIAGKMSEGLYQKLADMGPEGYKYVHAFASMTEEQLMQVNQLYAQSLVIPTTVTAQIYEGMATASSNAYTGFIRGLNIPAMQMQGVSLATTFLAGVNDGFGITSNSSSKMYEKGTASTQGLTEGINDSGAQAELKTAANDTGTAVVDEVDTTMGEEAMMPIGEQTANGLATGIRSGKSNVINAVTEVCTAAKNTATTTMQIQSPSKVFAKIGGFIDAGLAKGISDNTDLVNVSMGKLADSAVDNMADAIAAIQSAVNADMDVEPVIRPVVDLSNIQNGGRTINSLMRSNLGFGVNMPAANFMSSSETVNTSDNSDVVNAINSLKGDVISLKDSMANIKMVLDTGTLVGAMTPAMDKKLGIRKMYLERGM